MRKAFHSVEGSMLRDLFDGLVTLAGVAGILVLAWGLQ